MKFLLLLRDFLYSFLLKKHGETYAKREYKYVFGGILCLYYMIFLTVVATLQFKLKFAIVVMRKDIYSLILNGIVLFAPFLILLYLIHRLLPPLDTIDIEESTTFQKKRTVIIFFVSGIILLFLIPYLLSVVIEKV
ncbi:hypothetical protein C0V77_20215 [Emticicia sp. TH156]|nr:hypothetical protein C0V77_20215 [Emticicia sp. TH156]